MSDRASGRLGLHPPPLPTYIQHDIIILLRQVIVKTVDANKGLSKPTALQGLLMFYARAQPPLRARRQFLPLSDIELIMADTSNASRTTVIEYVGLEHRQAGGGGATPVTSSGLHKGNESRVEAKAQEIPMQ